MAALLAERSLESGWNCGGQRRMARKFKGLLRGWRLGTKSCWGGCVKRRGQNIMARLANRLKRRRTKRLWNKIANLAEDGEFGACCIDQPDFPFESRFKDHVVKSFLLVWCLQVHKEPIWCAQGVCSYWSPHCCLR